MDQLQQVATPPLYPQRPCCTKKVPAGFAPHCGGGVGIPHQAHSPQNNFGLAPLSAPPLKVQRLPGSEFAGKGSGAWSHPPTNMVADVTISPADVVQQMTTGPKSNTVIGMVV